MAAKTRTREDYARRIARAAALIAARPDSAPRLEDLASAAAFSPFHFHRVYRAMTGETPAETAIRLRLHHAASRLLRGPAPIAAVAREAGYGSVPGFTRAFRAAHGVPPGAYRAQGGIGQPTRTATPSEDQDMIEVSIRTLPALRLAAIDHQGAYNDIGDAFGRLELWARGRGLVDETTRWFGIYHDDPKSVPAAALRSQACLTVPAGTTPEGTIRLIDLPERRVAALRFRGPYAELEAAYAALYGEWLPESGEEPADEPCVEEYLNDVRTTPPAELLTDIMMPLRATIPA
jgi:AraC family transcriptional regulator